MERKDYVIFVGEVFMRKDGFNIVDPIRMLPNCTGVHLQERLRFEVENIQGRKLPVSEVKSVMNESNSSHHIVSGNRNVNLQ